jgi:hypothetical protein
MTDNEEAVQVASDLATIKKRSENLCECLIITSLFIVDNHNCGMHLSIEDGIDRKVKLLPCVEAIL